jgi:hypothetical protein
MNKVISKDEFLNNTTPDELFCVVSEFLYRRRFRKIKSQQQYEQMPEEVREWAYPLDEEVGEIVNEMLQKV